MATASINVQAVTSTSEIHNTRTQSLSYVIEERIELNESWPAKEDMQSIADREKEVRSLCKELTGRKMRSSATPIREAVVNLAEETTMDDLLNLKDVLKEKFKVDCFQIHIHRDEGRLVDEKGKTQYTKVKGGWKSPEGKIIKDPTEQNPNLKFKENRHAHMVFDWQNKDTGKMIRHGKGIMSQMQTETAKALKMDRGELKTNSNRERLEPIEYKREQEQIRFNELQQQIEQLEQKKNTAERENSLASEEYRRAQEANERLERENFAEGERVRQRAEELLRKGWKDLEAVHDFTEEEISLVISELNDRLPKIHANIEHYQRESGGLEAEIRQIESSTKHREYESFKYRIGVFARQEEEARARKEESEIKRTMAEQGKGAGEIHRALEEYRKRSRI